MLDLVPRNEVGRLKPLVACSLLGLLVPLLPKLEVLYNAKIAPTWQQFGGYPQQPSRNVLSGLKLTVT